MKVLSIGNSFSEDSHRWLHKLAVAEGINLETVNLYIGGCTLEMHFKNIEENNAYYDFQPNGEFGERKISITEALKLCEWDVITIQQMSGFSGLYETYEPYLSSVISTVKQICPKAKLYFHQTWAYEQGFDNGNFAFYDYNQAKMFDCIKETSEKAAKSIEADIIPTGTVIQALRETVAEFDYKNGGISLCRDGYHLSYDYGRFAAAAIWLRKITGKNIKTTNFEDFDSRILEKIIGVVNGTTIDN
ncbi:MAG: DUF4886 domain-containing protein [Clostridia bacterium]|nr:DUF4886 domain-containing protein [Clostridia bacterium]